MAIAPLAERHTTFRRTNWEGWDIQKITHRTDEDGSILYETNFYLRQPASYGISAEVHLKYRITHDINELGDERIIEWINESGEVYRREVTQVECTGEKYGATPGH